MVRQLDGGTTFALLAKWLGYACVVGLAVFFYRLYRVRMLVRRARKDYGIPMMPHSFLFGHLISIAKVLMKNKAPRDLNGHWVFSLILKEYPEIEKCGVIYMDPWPIGHAMIAVTHPGIPSQFVMNPSLPKFYALREHEFGPLTNRQDILTLEGQAWKDQRTLYNPGFSTKNLASMTPWFIDEVLTFKNRLLRAAETQETVRLEQYTMDLTFDAICRATFDIRTKAQEQQEPTWAHTLRKQAELLYFNLDLLKQLNPNVAFKHWRYNRIIQDAVRPLIQNAHAKSTHDKHLDGPKTIVGLAVKPYVQKGEQIPPDLIEKIVNNIKMFIFAGHDTTSTAMAMMFYVLYRNPDKLAALRAEHDAILGPPDQAIEAIRADHTILNKLTYTTAVGKEILRMWPPVDGTIRESTSPDFLLTNPDTGARFPTYGFMIHTAGAYIQNNPKYWHKPDEFIPERFLVRDPDDPLYPQKNTWIPFSFGPRSCIGQEMVHIELRLALALTAREFDIIPQYPKGSPTFRGQEAYQVILPNNITSARNKDDVPVKVKRRAV